MLKHWLQPFIFPLRRLKFWSIHRVQTHMSPASCHSMNHLYTDPSSPSSPSFSCRDFFLWTHGRSQHQLGWWSEGGYHWYHWYHWACHVAHPKCKISPCTAGIGIRIQWSRHIQRIFSNSWTPKKSDHAIALSPSSASSASSSSAWKVRCARETTVMKKLRFRELRMMRSKSLNITRFEFI